MISLLLVLAPGALAGRTWYVDGMGADTEHLGIAISLNVIGSGASTTIIDGQRAGPVIAILGYPNAQVVSLSNITIRTVANQMPLAAKLGPVGGLGPVCSLPKTALVELPSFTAHD